MSHPSENVIRNNGNNDLSTDLASLITQVGTTWGVKSQPSEPHFRVFIDINNIITSCDCLSFISTRVPCIHMCMLKWYNKGIILAHSNQPAHVPPHSLPSHQQPMQQAPPLLPMQQTPQSIPQTMPQTMPQTQTMPHSQPVQPPPPLPQQPQNRTSIPSKQSNASSMAMPVSQQPRDQTFALPRKRGRPRNIPVSPFKRPGDQKTHASALTQLVQPTIPSTSQPANRTVNLLANPPVIQPAKRAINPFARHSFPPSEPQQASPVQQAFALQSPTSSAIQQQLQLELIQLLQRQRPNTIQKQPEQAKNIDKLVALLTELDKKHQEIKPSCSTSPPSLPPNMNSDIVLRGKKIALEAQGAMRDGVNDKALEDFIMAMLERERTDIAFKSSSLSISTDNASSPSTSSTQANPNTPAKDATTTATAAAANASSPISINSGPSTPITSSPLATSATSSPARKRLFLPKSPVVDSKPQSSVVNTPSTSIAPATPPTTLSPVSPPLRIPCNSRSTTTANTSAPNASTSTSNATATTSTLTTAASLASVSKSPVASSSSIFSSPSPTGKRRRPLPSFAMTDYLRIKQKVKPEKKYVKSEDHSLQRKSYPAVEPMEGYDTAITRMINNMKNEKNSSSDPWSISSSSEDEDDDFD